jgi:hypothetical protein
MRPPRRAWPPCVKCGSIKGWEGPKYSFVPTFSGREMEQLLFTCQACGYQRSEPTKDAPPPPLPETPPVCSCGKGGVCAVHWAVIFPPRGYELRRIPEAPWWAFWR